MCKHTLLCILMILVHFLTSSPLVGDVESGVKSCLKICGNQYWKTRKFVYGPTSSGASSRNSLYVLL